MVPPQIISREAIQTFLAAAALGFAVWLAAPWLVDRREPWDADWPFYSASLVLGGTAVTWWQPKQVAATYVGVWLGQVAAPGFAAGAYRLVAAGRDNHRRRQSVCALRRFAGEPLAPLLLPIERKFRSARWCLSHARKKLIGYSSTVDIAATQSDKISQCSG